jgi:dTDP-4-dehydrorhamnose 3,5-epimerase-like enzyme
MNAVYVSPSKFRIADLRLTELPRHIGDNGVLTILEGEVHVPFPIARIFTLQAPIGAIRGMHAHRRCAQFMICPQGAVNIVCNDGSEQKSFLLNRSDIGLLVPPKVWAVEVFNDANSLLIVICNRRYEEYDYISDYTKFLAVRGQE